MKSKKVIIGMAVTLFCLVLVGAFLAQGYETEGSELRCAVVRNVVPYSFQLVPNANNEAMATLTSEDSLEDLENAYYYQMIEDKYKH